MARALAAQAAATNPTDAAAHPRSSGQPTAGAKRDPARKRRGRRLGIGKDVDQWKRCKLKIGWDGGQGGKAGGCDATGRRFDRQTKSIGQRKNPPHGNLKCWG
eukprot:GHVT01104938.1.p2 GENE.GHVT01104938.1~~GHVT01104938.1.p2  ORF type:complete len:103 (-),score=19.94 GHVT01104938.1:981-1289(-)